MASGFPTYAVLKNDKCNNNNLDDREKLLVAPAVQTCSDIRSSMNNLHTLQATCGDGSRKCIYQCNNSRCALKNNFIARDKVVSSCTKRIYDCVTPAGTSKIDCHSANVVYLITCANCGLQYVGETVKRLNERFTSHRAGIKNPEKHGTCKILSNHFNKGKCIGSHYTVQVIKKVESYRRFSNVCLPYEQQQKSP